MILSNISTIAIAIGIVAPSAIGRPANRLAASPSLAEPAISPDRREIAFVSGGDIWTVPSAGGEARLLVSHQATESRPLYSPDGTRLAFTSTRTGNGDLYVLTFATGALQRITFDDVLDQLDGWSRDGRFLYFSSASRDISAMNDVYRVSSTGGTPVQVAADRYVNEYWAAASPTDPGTIAITARGRVSADWWRHGHSHIDESEIWLVKNVAPASGGAPAYEKLSGGGHKEAWPMWAADGQSIYFVSDQNGAENVWVKPVGDRAARAITSFRDGRVLWPSISADGRAIVFERDFAVWTLDPSNGRASAIPITLRGASAGPVVDRQTVTTGFASLALSPDGRKIAFTARGDVFAASARDGGEGTRATDTPSPETQLVWAGDSRRLVYVSGRDGPTHLYMYDFVARTETPLTSTPLPDVDPAISPDGKQIAFVRGGRELRVIELDTKVERLLTTGIFDKPPFVSDRALAWSPDGKWLAYASIGAGGFRNVYVIPSAGGTPNQVSFLPNAFGSSVAWSGDGTYLLLDTSQRTEDPQIIRVDLVPRTPRFREDTFRDLFRDGPTRPGTPTDPAPIRAPARPDSATRDSTARPATATRPAFDFEGVRRRATVLSTGVNAGSVIVSPDGKNALLVATVGTQTNLFTYPLDELSTDAGVARQLTSTAGGKSRPQFTQDSREVWYLEGGRVMAINVESRTARAINVSAETEADFEREKTTVFEQAWSILADNFFDPKMNGADWPKLRDEYRPRIEAARTTDEMRRLMRLMIGELNASHTGVGGAGFAPQTNIGRLGVRFDRGEYERSGALRITEVLALSPGALAKDLSVGDYIIAVDGTRVSTRTNFDSLLMHKIDRRVSLTVSRTADGAASREVALRPVNGATEKGLLYRDWVESRRAYVAKASNGRLGYVHMIDMGQGTLNQLYLDLDTENRGRDGVVIDIRNNNGGFVNAYALDIFTRAHYLTMTNRGSVPAPARSQLGQRSLEKPTALVVNQHSLSDAEDFTEGYRAMKLGPIIGEPTAGWIIYTSDVGLIDGSTVRVPFIRITDAAGKDMEMAPRPVDQLVVRPVGESYSGRDSQLDAAVAALLKRLPAR